MLNTLARIDRPLSVEGKIRRPKNVTQLDFDQEESISHPQYSHMKSTRRVQQPHTFRGIRRGWAMAVRLVSFCRASYLGHKVLSIVRSTLARTSSPKNHFHGFTSL